MAVQILVIDDDAIIRKLFSMYFQKQGYLVSSAASVEEGFEVLRHSKIDVVICDVIMPGMNGCDFLKIVKSDPNLDHIPVIVLSATGPQDEMLLLELKAARVISKPCIPQELEKVILELL